MVLDAPREAVERFDCSAGREHEVNAPIVTPCHGAPLLILTQSEGRAYMQTDVPSEIICTAEGCYNSWSAEGEPDSYNKPGDAPLVTDPTVPQEGNTT